ncbi:MAG: YchJ family protein [Candidatus Delongbacteria bacterium]|nr:YchJ family protein [Candidatus Delongbacteria bacterium]MBN2833752.1 YchJ family protein [Candidatus Delongbacteria bacterium]
MNKCPCGIDKTYEECCGAIINGNKLAETPESLMRSRYSAYVKGEVDYIKSSMHPVKQKEFNRENVEEWSKQSTWQKLEIIGNSSLSDGTGIVEFKAHYSVEGNEHIHHEIAQFKKHEDKWFFYDGRDVHEPIINEEPKVGRNDVCPCGSGKKYKKCCGK